MLACARGALDLGPTTGCGLEPCEPLQIVCRDKNGKSAVSKLSIVTGRRCPISCNSSHLRRWHVFCCIAVGKWRCTNKQQQQPNTGISRHQQPQRQKLETQYDNGRTAS